MKRETIFLKLALIFIAVPIVALCIFALPAIAKDASTSSKQMAYVLYGILAVMYVSLVPFFIGLYQAFKLLSYIDSNDAFSELSISSLKNIKLCAGVISLLYFFSMPLFYIVGEIDDAPGVILVGMAFVFAPLVITVFSAVLEKLLRNAIAIKKDNDLTI